jgi:hypothetical protein
MLTDLKLGAVSSRYIQSVRITVRGEKYVVLIGLDNGCKLGVDLHGRSTVYELSLSKVFEPVLRALHAVQEAMYTVRMWYGTMF